MIDYILETEQCQKKTRKAQTKMVASDIGL